VGAGDGYEVPFYRELGLDPVICFEPLAYAQQLFTQRNPTEPEPEPYALSDYDGEAQLNVALGDGQDSSLLEKVRPVGGVLPMVAVEVRKFSTWTGGDGLHDSLDTLVIDVQGVELQALKGMGHWIEHFKYLCIECSKVPIYKTEATAQEVIDFLTAFTPVTPISEHDDILFVRTDVLLPEVKVPTIHDEIPEGTMLNIGSGQRRFDIEQGWVNIDRISRPPDQVPDFICDVGKEDLPYKEGSIDICALHHVLEHFGCGEADTLLRNCWRVLKPSGSLLVFVPDTMAIARRYILRQIDDYTLRVLTYGAYQGAEEDRHRWGYDYASLQIHLEKVLDLKGGSVKFFNWRKIPGADLARDWWILGMEAVKE